MVAITKTAARRILVSLLAIQNTRGSCGKWNPTETTKATTKVSSSIVNNSKDIIVSGGVDCRSNTTHIVWREGVAQSPHGGGCDDSFAAQSSVRRERRAEEESFATSIASSCFVQTRKQAERDCLKFLQDHLMAFDRPFRETMGFPDPNDDDAGTADGLDYGLIQPTIRLALDAKVQYPWTDALPRDIFTEYVLNYANVNEARTNWRPLLVEALKFIESDLFRSGTDHANISSVTTWVNTHLWTKLARNVQQPIYFKSSQTPLIFDPMSTIAFGYASCTGTSILLCNALRSVGIAARVAGTPAWYGNATQGNHNWVEVYVGNEDAADSAATANDDDDTWKFLEPSPALPHVDTLEADPCSRWFCDPSRYPSSKVYAAKMSAYSSDGHFPLAWDLDCKDVPAVDRTDYYTRVCGPCHSEQK